MKELLLKFNDENGEDRSVPVRAEKFLIGRTPDNDLYVQRSELSRRHAEINRFDDVFVISDSGSSNGTTVNGSEVFNPVALQDGDLINLGGGLTIKVELVESHSQPQGGFPAPVLSDAPSNANSFNDAAGTMPEASAGEFPVASPTNLTAAVPHAAAAAPNISVDSQKSGSSVSTALFIIAPVFALLVLLCGGGLLLLFSGQEREPSISSGEEPSYSSRNENKRKTEEETPTPKPKESPSSTVTNSNSNSKIEQVTPTPSSNSTGASGEIDKIERSALPFMRRIAIKDDTYVFTQAQLGEINSQIKSFKGSSALRDNLKAVKRDAAKFEELAKSKGLKPQFLATAALARIGNQSQNPLSTAQTMLPILGELRITLNNELADDNLLIVAAYDLGEQGKFRAMQSTLEALSKQTTGVASNKIRTIWFLRDKGKISPAQYALALRFLAIGAITQNPKDFGIDAEPVVFN